MSVRGEQLHVESRDAVEVAAAEAARLIARGETKEAVVLAKKTHASNANPATEELLISTYLARLGALKRRGLTFEVASLAELVKARFPAARERLRLALAEPLSAAGSSGRACSELDRTLEPLADPHLPADRRREIEDHLRRTLARPGELARSSVLPAGDPLRPHGAE